MKRILVILGAALLACAALGGILYGANEAFGKTKTDSRAIAQPVDEIVVDGDVGDVQLVAGDDRVQVRETRHYVVRRPKVTQTVERGVLTLKSECPNGFFLDCETDFRIEVPAGVAVRVKTDVGTVRAEALESADVRVQTDVGDIELDLAGQPERVEARTDVGDVDIALPRASYAVDTDTDVGDNDVEGLVQDDRSPRSISVRTDVGDVLLHAR